MQHLPHRIQYRHIMRVLGRSKEPQNRKCRELEFSHSYRPIVPAYKPNPSSPRAWKVNRFQWQKSNEKEINLHRTTEQAAM